MVHAPRDGAVRRFRRPVGHFEVEGCLLCMTGISMEDARAGGEAILRRAAAGDETAFARLIQSHDEAMRRVAYVVAGDWDIAGEAVQAAWSIAWRRLRSVREPERVEAWL